MPSKERGSYFRFGRGEISTMELIYLYVRKYGTIFQDQEFNFSSNFRASFKERKLKIEENRDSIKNYYGDNISSVTLFLGENGMGKTTLLDILGMRRRDRIRDTLTKKEGIKYSYFMVYHLYDVHFAFEFVDESFLIGEERISNIDMQGKKEKDAIYKLPMGTIFELVDGQFIYSDNVISVWQKNNKISSNLEYAYITSDKYNYRINNEYVKQYDDDYMFERRYYLDEKSYESLYKYFAKLKEINSELFDEKVIYIENNIKVELDQYRRSEKVEKYLKDRKKELDRLFHLEKRIVTRIKKKNREVKQKDIRGAKEKFLWKFCAESIEYYFLEQFIGWSGGGQKKYEIDVKDSIPNEEEIEQLYGNGEKNLKWGRQRVEKFQVEYGRLLLQIEKNRDSNGTIDLKKVLEYVLNRVEIAAQGLVNIVDKNAVLKLIELFENLPENYFMDENTIKIQCDFEELEEDVIELTKLYDNCYKTRTDENGSNSIYRIIKIELAKMSEGQSAFLDVISKSTNAVNAIKSGESIVLLIDEPDKTLHPELARKFLDILLGSLSGCKDKKIQIVLTSHSPFIVTDILPENVYAIQIENGIRKICSNKETYATNIYYLLMDSFMMKNTFGENSYKNMRRIIERLKSKEKIENTELERIKKIIDRIGEQTVKQKLLQLYEQHQNNDKAKIIKLIKDETDEEKLRKIKGILEGNDQDRAF